jgi:hypothetical protein
MVVLVDKSRELEPGSVENWEAIVETTMLELEYWMAVDC